jgi:hypothetical protein
MSEAQLDFLLQKVSAEGRHLLETCFACKLKLQITLHYLTTGSCFWILSALF